jgi:uncharacterized protein DUF402
MAFFEAGRLIWQRMYFGSALAQVIPARVVRHDPAGLMVWVAGGSGVWRLRGPGGEPLRDRPREQWPTELGHDVWFGHGVLEWLPVAADHAVWWCWTDGGVFDGWYVNLERHAVWTDGPLAGVDIVDQELDGVVTPDHRWTWKDEESFADKTGHPAFWSASEAAAVRAEGERVRALAEAGAAPFDGTWCDFRPAPTWSVPERPAGGWDRPAALPLTADVPGGEVGFAAR